MSYWNLTPEYIISNWTDEKLALMTESLERRILKENGKEPPKEVSDELLFQSAQGIKVNKIGD